MPLKGLLSWELPAFSPQAWARGLGAKQRAGVAGRVGACVGPWRGGRARVPLAAPCCVEWGPRWPGLEQLPDGEVAAGETTAASPALGAPGPVSGPSDRGVEPPGMPAAQDGPHAVPQDGPHAVPLALGIQAVRAAPAEVFIFK